MGKFFITISVLVLTISTVLAYESTPYYNRPTSNMQVQNDFSEYMANLQNKLQKNWIAPDFLPEGRIRVLFKLDREGNVISGDILESSGNRIYDESAVNAIHKSEPFGRFPNNSTREILAVNYCFSTELINADKVKYYIEMADKSFRDDKKKALEFINLAINEAGTNEKAYYLYKKRGKIFESLGQHVEANEDFQKYENLKLKCDIKRVHAVKRLAEVEDSAFAYYYLANSYEQVQDYENAIKSIDEAIVRTNLNNTYKRYREELVKKSENL